MEIETTREKGDSLELAIVHLFSVVNIKAIRNVIECGYELDVKAEIGDRTIIVECKNYQNSSMTIRNLIHQWNSKNEILKAHKIVLAIAGLKIKESDYQLANELDIEIWSQDDISELFNLSLSPSELKKALLQKISLKPITISERYRIDITRIIIRDILSNSTLLQERLYRSFNQWLRAFILTELSLGNTDSEARLKHINLFEGSKTKSSFFNLIKKKRTQVEYWNTVYQALKSEFVLEQETQDRYADYMDQLKNEYAVQREYFETNKGLSTIKEIVRTRLHTAILSGEQICKFSGAKVPKPVVVTYDEQLFAITIEGLAEQQTNIINWILTTEAKSERIDEKQTKYLWVCPDIDEAAEWVYRLFSEFYDVSENLEIKDLTVLNV